MKENITIALVEDHLLFRQGMLALLNESKICEVLFDVGNGKELLESMRISQPEIILLDIDMPVMNGKQALDILKLKYPDIKVIMLSVHFEEFYILEFIKNGANAFLPKGSDISIVIEAIKSVHEVGYYYDEHISELIRIAGSDSKFIKGKDSKPLLTKREVEVWNLIRSGKTNNEIAELLFLSVRTVEWHRLNLSKKNFTKYNGNIYPLKNQ